MSSVRAKDTGPEMAVRRLVFKLGYRYRLHVRALPGNPDMVFVAKKKIINIHGCYWHRHQCKKGSSLPKTNEKFWQEKFKGNVVRDRLTETELRRLGWDVLIIWECQIKAETLSPKLEKFLERSR